MTPDRFRQIEDLYHAARAGTTERRAALLAQADPDLRLHVESLLSIEAETELMDRPAIGNAAALPGRATKMTPGTFLGPYQIESKLGAGGMGDVFRAMDTRLGRAVAIKTTKEQFSDRFEREARSISSLNHPHICTLYDVGPNYLVMELVEGDTLAGHLKSGPLPLKTALLYAAQIVSALIESHSKSIIHRDLKPGNIMIARTGVKVLDFGLAKSRFDENLTASHMVVGTPAYMSPEQRAGEPANARTDIYSFGCILYEMLTGTRMGFGRKRISPRRLETIVDRCLEEDPARRWQSAAELERQLSATPARGRRDGARVEGAGDAVARSGKFPSATATVVLGDFANTTGDPAFEGTLRPMMAVELRKSRDLTLLAEPRMREVLLLMGRSADTHLTPALASEIGERTGSTAVVDGSIARLGRQYILGVRARDCGTGDVLYEYQAPLAKKDDVFKALVRTAKQLVTRSGVFPKAAIHAPLATEVTTPSLEAWRSYNAAYNTVMRTGVWADSISLYKRATEVDPNFAMAYAALGRAYDALGQAELGAHYIAKAYELRGRVSDRENFFVTFNYYRQVPRNLELARQTLQSWLQKYPGDLHPHGFLSGLVSPGTGYHQKAAEEGQKAIEIDSDFAIGYFNTAFALLYLNRLVDSEALVRKATERGMEVPEFSLCRYFIAFLRNDVGAMQSEVSHRRAKAKAQGWFAHQEALTLAYHGRVNEANQLSEQAVSLARQGGLAGRAALFEGARAVWSALFGLRDDAQRSAAAALALARGRDADYGPAFALALLNDSGQAREIEGELNSRFPEDTSVQFSYLPAVRGLIALNDGDAAKALEITRVAIPYELAVPGTAYFTGASFFGALYPVYVRGLAFRQMGRPREAAAEFQKILAHPGIMLSDPIGPMARLQLVRALSDSGDLTNALDVCESLLTIWKQADADVPVVQQAKAEHAALSLRAHRTGNDVVVEAPGSS